MRTACIMLCLATAPASRLVVALQTASSQRGCLFRSAPRLVSQLQKSSAIRLFSVGGSTSKERLFSEEFNVLYDSKCNVCKLEIDFLRRRDERVNGPKQRKLKFTDLESETYDETAPQNGQITYAVGMSSMHGVTASGQVLKGVPVFEKAYQQVGLGWLFVVTRWPGFKQFANLLYAIFARYRTLITRGSSLDRLVESFEAKKTLEAQKSAVECVENRCSAKQN